MIKNLSTGRKLIFLNGNIKTIGPSRGDSINPEISGNIIKIISIKEFTQFLNSLNIYNIEEHFDNGLMRNTDKNGTISLLINTNQNDRRILKYHTFAIKPRQIGINSKSKGGLNYSDMNGQSVCIKNYDFPTYYPHAPPNFSIFCTQAEKDWVETYIIKKQYDPSKPRKPREDDDLDVNKPPAPRKEHNFCHLCMKRYTEYFSHLEDEYHIRKFKINSKVYQQIDGVFNQIKCFWREKRDKEKETNELIQLELFVNQLEDNPDLEYALFHTNEVVSTKFETNPANNIEIMSQINSVDVNICDDKEEIEMPQKIEDYIIKNEINDFGIKCEDQDETLLENATDLNQQRDVPTNFIDNKQQNLINYKIIEEESDNININKSFKQNKIIPQFKVEKNEINSNIQRQNIFNKRKFSQTNMNNFVSEIQKKSRGKFTILKIFKDKFTKEYPKLSNSVDNLKDIVTQTFSMNLR